LREVVLLAVFGAFGTLSRYGLSLAAYRTMGDGFPYGTLLVNVLGSLTFGFIMQVGLNSSLIPVSLRMAMTIGFLGAFTTFSTFSYETLKFLEDGAWGPAALNITTNVAISILAAVAGMALGRLVLRAF